MIAILGRKVGMTQFFDDLGNRIPVTMIQAGPCQVLRVKTSEGRDKYDAVVLGLGKGREKSMTKPELGVFRKLGTEPVEVVREIRVDPLTEAPLYQAGTAVDVSLFQAGEKGYVIGTSRGRGFQGVVKRHGFAGFPKTHGTHEYRRHPGSIGNRTWPGRTIKGRRMGGHMGDSQVTTVNLKLVAVIPGQNMMLIQGAVPGGPNNLVVVRKAVKVRLKKAH
ncbi:MAG: 50S ribosomal protein L3 [Deltaproteobacteria bacterium]|nr:50S ribosomal protein L3 [Deltaproteobacteria bacterium]